MRIFILFLALYSQWLLAAPSALNSYVPEALSPWIDWVKDPQQGCTWLGEARQCQWPGTLQLNLTDQGGSFRIAWQLQADAWLALPGNAEHWPEQVLVNEQPALVVEQDGRPMLWLKAGDYQLQGRWLWSSLPQRLAVPLEAAQVDVVYQGRQLRPRREAELLLLTEEQAQGTPEADSVTVKVFRQLRQAVPLELETHIELDVSGREREYAWSSILPAGFQAVSLTSPLPGRLSKDSGLELLLRPGHWSLQIQAVSKTLAATLARSTAKGWPEQEYWSFQADPALGLWQVTGEQAVDPSQTEIPRAWHQQPAWLVVDSPLELQQQAGSHQPKVAHLSLKRDLWLDFSGQQFLVRDHLTGDAGELSRLSLAAPFELLRVAQNGQDLLLTQSDSGTTGFELRDQGLNLDATSRLPRSTQIGVNGWLEALDSVQLNLHLPPAWQLLAVTGVDDDASWLFRWSLFDVFLALVMVIAATKLLGWFYGSSMLVLMLLSYQDADAPVSIWLWLMALTALARSLPAGRWRQLNQLLLNLSLMVLLWQALPYAIAELRQVLYPQLNWRSDTYQANSRYQTSSIAPAAPVASATEADMASMTNEEEPPQEARQNAPVILQEQAIVMEKTLRSKAKIQSQSRNQNQLAKQQSGAITQTGPGLPDWTGRVYQFALKGSVSHEQNLALWLLPPWLTRCLLVLKVLMLAVLVWALRPQLGSWRPKLNTLALMLGLGMWLGLTPSHSAWAQAASTNLPNAELLAELATRVNQAPICGTNCINLPLAELELSATSLQLDLHLVAQVDSSWTLPIIAREGRWTLDGQPARILISSQQAWLIQVPAGLHTASFSSSLPSQDLELQFPELPLRVAARLPADWQLQGLDQGRIQAGSLRLIPPQATRQLQQAERQWNSEIAPLVEVQRELELDQTWTLITRVKRIAPQLGAIRTQVPLLPTESILTDGVKADKGMVSVQLAPEQNELSWRSQLTPVGKLRWAASEKVEQTELWSIAYSSLWQVKTESLDATSRSADGDFQHVQYRPWPGQALELWIQKPVATQGSQLAIDSVLLSLEPGEQQEQGSLSFDYRSSTAGQHKLTLPVAVQLTSLMVDGQRQDFHLDQQRLWLPLLPGAHKVQLDFRRPLDNGNWYQSPVFDLGQAATNLRIQLLPASNKWLLFSQGPQVGPAILFWGELLMLLLLAVLLSRLNSPVRWYQWLILALGLSLSLWPVLLLLAFWFWSLQQRQVQPLADSRWLFNLRQVGLIFLSLSSLVALAVAISQSLLGQPDMHIVGNGSYAGQLNWFVDQTEAVLIRVSLLTVPVWLYRLILLVWSLWLASSLITWLVWGWRVYSRDGFWRSKPKLLAN